MFLKNASILVEDTLKEYFGDSGNIRKIQNVFRRETGAIYGNQRN